jgi:hypothetical protein
MLGDKKVNPYMHLSLAYASAESIVNQGYELVMYTDKIGKNLLNGFPYHELIVEENFDDVNRKMFAAPKYIALSKEPLNGLLKFRR